MAVAPGVVGREQVRLVVIGGHQVEQHHADAQRLVSRYPFPELLAVPTLPRNTFGAMPIEQVRHSPTCSRNARFTFPASSRVTGTCRSVPIRRHAISSI